MYMVLLCDDDIRFKLWASIYRWFLVVVLERRRTCPGSLTAASFTHNTHIQTGELRQCGAPLCQITLEIPSFCWLNRGQASYRKLPFGVLYTMVVPRLQNLLLQCSGVLQTKRCLELASESLKIWEKWGPALKECLDRGQGQPKRKDPPLPLAHSHYKQKNHTWGGLK